MRLELLHLQQRLREVRAPRHLLVELQQRCRGKLLKAGDGLRRRRAITATKTQLHPQEERESKETLPSKVLRLVATAKGSRALKRSRLEVRKRANLETTLPQANLVLKLNKLGAQELRRARRKHERIIAPKQGSTKRAVRPSNQRENRSSCCLARRSATQAARGTPSSPKSFVLRRLGHG